RVMHASCPVKATERLSAELSNSTDVIAPPAGSRPTSLLAGSLFSRPTNSRTGRRCLLLLRIDAGPEGIDQIDHSRRWGPPDWCDLFAGFFLFEQVNKGILVSILEVGRIKMTRLVADDVTCKIHHVLRQLELGDVFEVWLFISDFIGISKSHAQQTPPPRLKCDDVLPARQHDAAERDHVHFADGVADDGKRILSDLTIGSDVIGRVDVAIIDLVSRNELIDFNGPSALDFDSLKFFVLNDEILPLADLVTARDVLARNHLAGF